MEFYLFLVALGAGMPFVAYLKRGPSTKTKTMQSGDQHVTYSTGVTNEWSVGEFFMVLMCCAVMGFTGFGLFMGPWMLCQTAEPKPSTNTVKMDYRSNDGRIVAEAPKTAANRHLVD
jgi:hypothetical protein